MIKKNFLLFCCCLLSCKGYGQQSYNIQCNVNGAYGHTIYLMDFMGSRMNDEQRPPIDSVIADSDTFNFTGEFYGYNIYSISVGKSPKYREFVIDTGKFEITADIDKLENAVIEGSHQNDLFKKLIEIKTPIIQRINDLGKQNQSQDSMVGVYKNAILDFTKQYPDSYASFLEGFSLLIPDIIDSNYLFADSFYNLLDVSIRNTRDGRYLFSLLSPYKSNILVGKSFPQLIVHDTARDITTIKMEDKGIYLIYYWASWDSQSISQMERLSLLYQQYRKQGFEIILVSIDISYKVWMNAIKKLPIRWPNYLLIQSAEKGDGAPLSITRLPYSILIGKNKRIEQLNPLETEIRTYLNTH